MSLQIGQQLGSYEIASFPGKGGDAEVLATLNQPHIAQICGLEESENTRCIAMELVNCETLQERLKRGPLLVDDALQVAKQICEALEAAH
jgi:serine/threonine protein kinase